MRTINRKTKEHIDYNIDKIYNYFRVGNPYLLNLDNQFREIQLLDLSLNQKIKRKRQLVINSCNEAQFEKEWEKYNEDGYGSFLGDRPSYGKQKELFATLGIRIYVLYRIIDKNYNNWKHGYIKFDRGEIIDLFHNDDLEEYLNLIINLFKKKFPFFFYTQIDSDNEEFYEEYSNEINLSLEELRYFDSYDMDQIEILNKLIIHIPQIKFKYIGCNGNKIVPILRGITSFFMDILIENFTNEEFNRFINIFLRSDLHIYYWDTIKAVKEDFSELQIETIIRLQNNGFTYPYNAFAFNAVLNKFSERQIETMLQFFNKEILDIKFNPLSDKHIAPHHTDEYHFWYSLQQFAYNVADLDLSKEKVNKIISIINKIEPDTLDIDIVGYAYHDDNKHIYEHMLKDVLNSVI